MKRMRVLTLFLLSLSTCTFAVAQSPEGKVSESKDVLTLKQRIARFEATRASIWPLTRGLPTVIRLGFLAAAARAHFAFVTKHT